MNCKESSTTYSSIRLPANANMACKGTTQTHLCTSLTPAQHHLFRSGLYLSGLCFPQSTNSGIAFPFVRSSFQLCSRVLLGDNYYFPRMEMLYLRPSVLNSSYSCSFSYNTMANLEEQATLRTTGTVVPKGQTCRHKDPQGHLTRHLL